LEGAIIPKAHVAAHSPCSPREASEETPIGVNLDFVVAVAPVEVLIRRAAEFLFGELDVISSKIAVISEPRPRDR
jgi:hypothetical protein